MKHGAGIPQATVTAESQAVFSWVLGFIALLWFQLFFTLIPSWRDGEYYEYGWFVAPLAIGLAWNRWQWLRESQGPPPFVPHGHGLRKLILLQLMLVLLVIAPMRVLLHVDPYWRLLLVGEALLVAATTHLLLGHFLGRRISLAFLPVTIYALTAVPYPTAIETALVTQLTRWVSVLACEIFLLAGMPVELSGERLAMGREVVSVNEGCSGIRSLQSLVMVALFFGEMLLLSLPRRVILLAVAASCALIINTLRAYHLANIHFTQGKEAFDRAHDMVGHVAFACSAVILYLAARLLLSSRRGSRQVRRIRVTTPNSTPP
jgi:exosortase